MHFHNPLDICLDEIKSYNLSEDEALELIEQILNFANSSSYSSSFQPSSPFSLDEKHYKIKNGKDKSSLKNFFFPYVPLSTSSSALFPFSSSAYVLNECLQQFYIVKNVVKNHSEHPTVQVYVHTLLQIFSKHLENSSSSSSCLEEDSPEEDLGEIIAILLRLFLMHLSNLYDIRKDENAFNTFIKCFHLSYKNVKCLYQLLLCLKVVFNIYDKNGAASSKGNLPNNSNGSDDINNNHKNNTETDHFSSSSFLPYSSFFCNMRLLHEILLMHVCHNSAIIRHVSECIYTILIKQICVPSSVDSYPLAVASSSSVVISSSSSPPLSSSFNFLHKTFPRVSAQSAESSSDLFLNVLFSFVNNLFLNTNDVTALRFYSNNEKEKKNIFSAKMKQEAQEKIKQVDSINMCANYLSEFLKQIVHFFNLEEKEKIIKFFIHIAGKKVSNCESAVLCLWKNVIEEILDENIKEKKEEISQLIDEKKNDDNSNCIINYSTMHAHPGKEDECKEMYTKKFFFYSNKTEEMLKMKNRYEDFLFTAKWIHLYCKSLIKSVECFLLIHRGFEYGFLNMHNSVLWRGITDKLVFILESFKAYAAYSHGTILTQLYESSRDMLHVFSKIPDDAPITIFSAFLTKLMDVRYKAFYKNLFGLFCCLFDSFFNTCILSFVLQEKEKKNKILEKKKLTFKEKKEEKEEEEKEKEKEEEEEEENEDEKKNIEENVSEYVEKYIKKNYANYEKIIGNMFSLLGYINTSVDVSKEEMNGLLINPTYALQFEHDIELCVGRIINVFGLPKFLERFPLRVAEISLRESNFLSKSNSWILTYLNKFLKRGHLLFFYNYFLPLASTLRKKHEMFKGKGSLEEAKMCRQLCDQVWSLLPNFLSEPFDFSSAFCYKDFALRNILGNVALNDDVLCEYVCKGIVNICKFYDNNTYNGNTSICNGSYNACFPSSSSPFCKVKYFINRSALSEHANYIIGLLVSKFLRLHGGNEKMQENGKENERPRGMSGGHMHMYTSTPNLKIVQHLLDAISALAAYSDTQVMEKNIGSFTKAFHDALENRPSIFSEKQLGAMMDIIDAILLSTSHTCVQSVLNVCEDIVRRSAQIEEEKNSTRSNENMKVIKLVEKRAYKCIKHICIHNYIHHIFSNKNSLYHLWESFKIARNASSPTTLKNRLSCLQSFIELFGKMLTEINGLHEKLDSIVTALIPELLVCLTEVNHTVRRNAFAILTAIAEIKIDDLSSILVLLVAGLGGLSGKNSCDSPMKCAAILAITRLMHSFGDKVDMHMLNNLLPSMTLLLNDPNRIVFKSALNFIKASIYILPEETIQERAPEILNSMFKSVHAPKAKVLLRRIVQKLMKKIGYDKLEKIFPENEKALLMYVQRSIRRHAAKSKQHSLNGDGYDEDEQYSDDDSMDSDDVFSDDEGKKRKNKLTLLKKKRMNIEGKKVLSIKTTKKQIDKKKEKLKTKKAKNNDRIDEDSSDDDRSEKNLYKKHKKNTKGEEFMDDEDEEGEIVWKEDGRGVFRTKKDTNNKDERKTQDATTNLKKKKVSILSKNSSFPRYNLSKLKDDRERLKLKKTKKTRKPGHILEKSGEEFKAKKGQGDVLKGSSLQPYAYLKLNPKMLKEKYKNKAVHSLAAISGRSTKKKTAKGIRGGKGKTFRRKKAF